MNQARGFHYLHPMKAHFQKDPSLQRAFVYFHPVMGLTPQETYVYNGLIHDSFLRLEFKDSPCPLMEALDIPLPK